jgi:DNA-binding NtrC family response regulator
VEDQELWREQFFGEALRDLGFAVFSASTKEEALTLLNEREFNLAVIDINLTAVTGNTDGLAVAEYLDQTGSTIPIIVVSGTDGGFRVLHERHYRIFAEIPKDLFNLELFISQVELAMTEADTLTPDPSGAVDKN